MYTQIMTPTENSLTVSVPHEMIGHTVRVTLDEIENEQRPDISQFASIEEVHAHFNAIQLDLRGWKFDRQEANRRHW